MEKRQKLWIAPVEACIGAVLSIMLATVFVGCGSKRTVDRAIQTKLLNNAKQITRACHLFATDNNGIFPNGNYDPTLGKITAAEPAGSAEACFNDLFDTKALEVERIFWSTVHEAQCSEEFPDEGQIGATVHSDLEPGENCWDYVAGMNNSSPKHLPLVFEASDDGEGKVWSEEAGHPWPGTVIIAYVDGSAEKTRCNEAGQIKIERGGKAVDLCVPVRGEDGWGKWAKLAPATPVK